MESMILVMVIGMTRVMERHFVLIQLTLYSMWELCHQYGLDMTFSPQSVQAKNDNIKISRNIIWVSLVHGSITSLVDIFNYEFNYITLSLTINELKCNPSPLLTKCVLSELFSWVSIYCNSKTLLIIIIIYYTD